MAFLDLLPEAPRQQLELMADELRVQAGTQLIRTGEPGGDLYRVVSGSLEVVDISGHPEVVLDIIGPGAVVGEMAFLSEAPRSADVRAFEDTHLLRWRSEPLRARLVADAALARDVYLALAKVMSARLRHNNAQAPGVAELTGPDEAAGARRLVEALKSDLLRLEVPLRRGESGGQRALADTWGAFLRRGERLFRSLTDRERGRAGELMRRELSPYLLRARTAELCLSGQRGASAALNHIERGAARGGDPLGVALDRALLATPTSRALRARRELSEERAAQLLGDGVERRVSVIGCGSGALPTTLGMLLGGGSDLACVDGEREVLDRLDSATISRDPGLSLRLVNEDLSELCLGSSQLYLADQDLIVLHGLLEYLPESLIPELLRWAAGCLAPGGALVIERLAPSEDAFLFDHVLRWRLLRRARPTTPPPGLRREGEEAARHGAAVAVLRVDRAPGRG